jgi:ankyrin repeat protein
MQFTRRDAPLERAIEADDPDAVGTAIAGGASVNARGAHDVTPLEYAIGTSRKRAAAALIAHHADPNLRDVEGDSAVSLAVNAYKRDPSLLTMVLDAGGDPNARRPDGEPVMVRFLNDRNLDAISYLHARGADIDAEVDGQPMVVDAAYGVDWDVVWHLIQLGARTDTPKAAAGLIEAFKVPGATLPDSPIYPFKVKVWKHLKAEGLDPAPPAGVHRG